MAKAMHRPPAHHHPLVEPRLVASVGLVALGDGIGVGLMLAKMLIVVGLVLSLASSLGVLAIYRPHFANAYNTLNRRKSYSGARPLELVVALLLICISIPLSIVIFLNVRNEIKYDNLQNGAKIDLFDGPAEYIKSGNYFLFPVFMLNNGDTPVEQFTFLFHQFPAAHVLSSTEESVEFDRTYAIGLAEYKKQVDATKRGIIGTNQIAPKILTRQWDNNLHVTEAQMSAIGKGELYLYNMVVMFYADGSPNGITFVSEHCARFDGPLDRFVECAEHNMEKQPL